MIKGNPWPAVVIAGVAMLVAGGLAMAKVDKEVILLILTISATPVITALISQQVGETKGVVSAVQQQTNGNWSKALDVLDRMGQSLAAAMPAPASSSSTSSTSPPAGSSTSTAPEGGGAPNVAGAPAAP